MLLEMCATPRELPKWLLQSTDPKHVFATKVLTHVPNWSTSKISMASDAKTQHDNRKSVVIVQNVC